MSSPDSEDAGLEVPWERLSPEALEGVVEEFITREGTDYGHVEATFDDKRKAVLRQLQQGRAVIHYDPVSQTCTLSAVD